MKARKLVFEKSTAINSTKDIKQLYLHKKCNTLILIPRIFINILLHQHTFLGLFLIFLHIWMG